MQLCVTCVWLCYWGWHTCDIQRQLCGCTSTSTSMRWIFRGDCYCCRELSSRTNQDVWTPGQWPQHWGQVHWQYRWVAFAKTSLSGSRRYNCTILLYWTYFIDILENTGIRHLEFQALNNILEFHKKYTGIWVYCWCDYLAMFIFVMPINC